MEGSSKNNSSTKAKPAKRKAENVEDRNRKSKRARRIKNEAAGSSGTIASNNDDHTAATVSLSGLPVDVLMKIVKMLPMAQWASLESVSLRFRGAAFEAWRSVQKIHLDEDFVFKNRDGVGKENGVDVLECLLEKLLLRSPNINEISGFASIRPVTPEQRNRCFHLLGQFNSLQRISFANWDDDRGDEVATFLGQSNNRGKFKEVDMSGLKYFEGADILATDALGPISLGDDDLKLEKFWCRDTSARSLLNLAGVSLTTLSVVDTRVSPEYLHALINRNDRLEHLGFSVSGFDEAKELLAYTQLFSAIAALTSKNLSVLKIGHRYFPFWPSLHSELAHLLEECGRCRRLKELSLTQRDICTTRIVYLIAHLTHLTRLSIGCDAAISESLINLTTKLTRLQKLKIIDWNYALDGAVVAAVATNLIELESLELSCFILPPVSLENLGLLTNLKNLHIDADHVDNDVLKAWSGGFGSNLESLTLRHQPRSLFLRGFSTLVKKASQLRHLDLGRTRIMDRHLRLIASSCPLLCELYAGQGHAGVTARGIEAIIDGCRQLKWLDIPIPVTPRPWNVGRLNVGRYRKINFSRRLTKAPFGKDG